MMGLKLGASRRAVQALLGQHGSVVTFPNSPRLTVDCRPDGGVYLRAAEHREGSYDWQDIVARLSFERDELVGIMVSLNAGGEAFAYAGKLFDKIGLGAPVADLLAFASFGYDEVEEVFFSDRYGGLEVGGAGACNLSENPLQPVTSLRVYRHAPLGRPG